MAKDFTCHPPSDYSVTVRPVDLGGKRLKLHLVAEPNALADAVDPGTFAEDERFPYWAELWPSAVALARHLLRQDLRGIEALELGCGTGLAGVAAAMAGAKVLFTDFEADALAFARANHALNLGRPGETRLVDWRSPPRNLRFPLVIAADVLYERRFLLPFVHCLQRTVGAGGRALIAEPGRAIAEGTVERLEGRGWQRGLHLEEFTFGGREHAVWIHELSRISTEGSPA